MRPAIVLSAALLAGSATAAPVPDLISSILGLITNDLTKLLKSLSITLQTNGTSHGITVNFQNQCPFTFPAVTPNNTRYGHDLTWPSVSNNGNFVNWTTFKSQWCKSWRLAGEGADS